LIRSFPEVDESRTAVTGISWGGYLTCIVAGVDNRFRAAVPVYGCGFLHENSAWLDRFAKMNADERERLITLWDPSRYLPAVSMPILFMNGTNDFAYPLDSYMKSYDVVSSTKQFCVTVNMPHSHPDGWARSEIGMFIDQQLLGERAMPTVNEPKVTDGKIHVSTTSSGRIVDAALHWTTDSGPINQRKWQTMAAQIADDEIVVEGPSADATAWFLSVTDDRGAVVSTRTIFVGN
jgi:PhoPQ-activated pathogenicity-related protein